MKQEDEHMTEHRCPICKGFNACNVEGDCWCFQMKVPMELRERIPKELKGKACICQKCVKNMKVISER